MPALRRYAKADPDDRQPAARSRPSFRALLFAGSALLVAAGLYLLSIAGAAVQTEYECVW